MCHQQNEWCLAQSGGAYYILVAGSGKTTIISKCSIVDSGGRASERLGNRTCYHAVTHWSVAVAGGGYGFHQYFIKYTAATARDPSRNIR